MKYFVFLFCGIALNLISSSAAADYETQQVINLVKQRMRMIDESAKSILEFSPWLEHVKAIPVFEYQPEPLRTLIEEVNSKIEGVTEAKDKAQDIYLTSFRAYRELANEQENFLNLFSETLGDLDEENNGNLDDRPKQKIAEIQTILTKVDQLAKDYVKKAKIAEEGLANKIFKNKFDTINRGYDALVSFAEKNLKYNKPKEIEKTDAAIKKAEMAARKTIITPLEEGIENPDLSASSLFFNKFNVDMETEYKKFIDKIKEYHKEVERKVAGEKGPGLLKKIQKIV